MMAKIVDPDLLIVGTNLTVDTSAKTIALNVAGSLIAKDGVTVQALYSKMIELWNSATYNKFPFPMYAIDALSGQFQFGTDGATFSGWKPANDSTRQMLRDGGWSEFSAAGALQRQYAGIVGLGAVSAGAQLYYQRDAADAPTNFTFTDQCNEGIQVYGDATNGNFDKRSYFKAFVREYAKKYKDSVLADTGKTASGAYIVNVLLSNEDDLKIQANDAAMSGAPYSGITVEFFGVNQNRSIGGSNYPFRIIINGNNATLEQIYTKVQYLLRQNSDIDSGAGTVNGKTAAALLAFSGDTLQTSLGVFIDNILPADSNRIVFKDQNGVDRTNPFTASGTLTFNAPLVGAGGYYRMYYTAPAGATNDYGESGAITVDNASNVAIQGAIGAASIAFDFDYDGDADGGTAGTDKGVTIVAGRPGFAKPVVATGTLSRSKGLSFALVAEADRAYLNP
jgi:hypothetical protein